jgi:hypothetical protein
VSEDGSRGAVTALSREHQAAGVTIDLIRMAATDIQAGTTPVTVTSVKLEAPRGVTMTKAWLMPFYKPPHGALSYVGAGEPYPPTSWHEWPNRQPIPGAVIKPGQGLNLFFGLTRTTAGPAWIDGPVITYTANRTSYTLQEQFGFQITGWPSCPRLGA